ncbi:MAG: ATP-binding cassette domain-containing protein [Phascolarctobacterium sp.]|nr:ATP-binding cassette domain-containing protein [Phascolarctobacterium sp.]
MQLVVDKIAKSFGANEIFKNVSFMLSKGEHAGLVGVNGSGKTTLLRCLLQPEFADAGTVSLASGATVGYVEQDFGSINGSIWQFMFSSCPEIPDLRSKLERLETESEKLSGRDLKSSLDDYARVTGRYEQLDGYNYETRIKRILIGLGYDENCWNQDTTSLSGGQKTRLMLAAALLRNPDIMILDEPTNHLDIVMTQWLEKYLAEFKGGLLIVSHDRAFLDNVVQRILELEGGHLQSFKGNYSRYLEQKVIQTATQEAAYAAQQEYIFRTEAYIRRFKAGIKSKMARGRQSQLDRLDRLEKPLQNKKFTLRLPPATECAEKVLVMENLSIGYEESILASDINLVLRRGEKTALLGANGTGKTTFLKTILGKIKPLKGTVKIGNRVHIGYFSQSYERLVPEQTLLENLLSEYGFTEERIRTLLGGMLFHGDDVFKKIGDLSGGQKARLVLLKLVLDGANCLVMDEPTNHLDILGREIVETALAAFDGTILLVSHDRYFVSGVADRIWEIEDLRIKDYKGNYEFYLQEKSKEQSPLKETKGHLRQSSEHRQMEVTGRTARSVKNKERRYSIEDAAKLLAKTELSIREQEAMQKLLEVKIADPASHTNLEQSRKLAEEHTAMQEKIDMLMERWEELMEVMEVQKEEKKDGM